MLIASTMRKGKAIKQSQGFDSNLSKVLELNNSYRIFVKKVFLEEEQLWDFIVGMVPGRSTDFEVTGTSFMKLDGDQLEVDEETNKYKDVSGMATWARIARIIHEARAKDEMDAKEDEAKRNAQKLHQPIDQVKLAQEHEAIKLRYFGGKAADGTNIMPKERPFISKLEFKSVMQILVVPLDAKGVPQPDKAKPAIFEPSAKRFQELTTILDNPAYNNVESEWLEVGYSYLGDSKETAGRNATFQGIAESLSIKTMYPEQWEKLQASFDKLVKGDSVDKTAELMVSRCISLAGKSSVQDVIQGIKKWCSTNPGVLTYIDVTSDDVKAAAKDLISFGLVDGAVDIKNSLEELIAAQNSTEAETAPAETEADKEDAEQANAVASVAKSVEGLSSTAQTLLQAAGGDLETVLGDGMETM